MRLGRIRHLPVIDDQERLVGVITERDLLTARDRGGRVLDLMHTDVKYVHPDSPAHQAAYLLLRHRIGCVPVVDSDEHVVGMVTDTDLVRIAYAVMGGAVPVDELEAEEREADHV
jgi:CBS domain-containing protein